MMKLFHFPITFILFSIIKNENFTVVAEVKTCGQVYGELIYSTEPVRIPQDCYVGLNASNCTTIQNFEKEKYRGGSFCPTICSRKNTIDALSGQKMRKKKTIKCGAVSQNVSFLSN